MFQLIPPGGAGLGFLPNGSNNDSISMKPAATLSGAAFCLEVMIYVGLRAGPAELVNVSTAPGIFWVVASLGTDGSLLITGHAGPAESDAPQFSISASAPAPGWRMLSLSVSGTTLTACLDGVLLGSATLEQAVSLTASTTWTAWAYDASAQAIAELRLWSTSRTADAIFSTCYQVTIEDPALVARWMFNAAPPSDWVASAPVTFAGAAAPATIATALQNTTADPNASGNGASVGDSSAVGIPKGSDYAFEAWVQPYTQPGAAGLRTLLARAQASAPDQSACYSWGIDAATGCIVFTPLGGGSQYAFKTVLATDRMSHVGLSYSQAKAIATLVVNGVQVEALAIPAHQRPAGGDGSRVTIGYLPQNPGGAQCWYGAIYMVRLWSTQRSADQLKANAHAFVLDDQGLLAEYIFDGAAQETAGRAPAPIVPVAADLSLATLITANPGSTGVAWRLTVETGAAAGEAENRRRTTKDTQRIAKVDADGLLSHHGRMRAEQPASLPVWLERRDGRLTLLLDHPDGVRLLATEGGDVDADLIWKLGLLLTIFVVVLQIWDIPTVEPQQGVEVFGQALASPVVDRALNALIAAPSATAVYNVMNAFSVSGRLMTILWDLTSFTSGAWLRSLASNLLVTFTPSGWPARILVGIGLGMTAISAWLSTEPQAAQQDQTQLTFLMYADRGEAMALEFTKADGSLWRMLVDGGYGAIEGYDLVSPPVTDYDVVCGTHIDDDHIYGIVRLLEALLIERQTDRIGQILFNGPPATCPYPPLPPTPTADDDEEDAVRKATDEAYNAYSWDRATRLAQRAKQAGIPVSTIQAGDAIPTLPAKLTATVFGPNVDNYDWVANSNYLPTPITRRSEAVNRASIMMTIGYQGQTLLLTGDGWDCEKAEQNPPSPAPAGHFKQDIRSAVPSGHVDIMKVPHHGSNDSSSAGFFAAVTADHYVCSSYSGGGNLLPTRDALTWIITGRRAIQGSYAFYFVLQPGDSRPLQLAMLQTLIDDPVFGYRRRSNQTYRIFVLDPNPGLSLRFVFTRDANDNPVILPPVAGASIAEIVQTAV